MEPKKQFMQKAIDVAKNSAKKGDYALGAIIVKNNKIISIGQTQLKSKKDPTVHAEIVAIRKACKKLNSKYLEDCILYTTHEPCSMCASAAIWAKMKGIVFGATRKDAEKHHTKKFTWRQINIKCKDVLKKGEPKLEIKEKFMRKECNQLFNLSK